MKNIVFEDKNVIVYNKPAGMLVQSDRSFDVDLVSRLRAYLTGKGEKPEVSVINRLDRPVSGLVLMAKNRESAACLSKQLQGGGINKEYYAVICGEMPQEKGVLVDWLLKEPKNNTSKIVKSSINGAKEARLEYEIIGKKTVSLLTGAETVSLVKIHLITGRHHQIRVQFAGNNTPLLGDTKYNPMYKEQKGWQNISLCSSRLEFQGKVFQIKPSGAGFEYFKEELETI